MRKEKPDLNQRLEQLLDGLAKSNTRLGRRCQREPRFYQWVVQVFRVLRDFYQQLGKDALQNFDAKVYQWITGPPDSYIGFVGELQVADWLRRKGVSHRFVQETPQPPRTPDIDATVENRRIYLEIRTMQENRYMRFAERVTEEIAAVSPGCSIMPQEVMVEEQKEEALVAIAVQRIRSALSGGLYNPVEYEGEEGRFSLVFKPGAKANSRQLPNTVFFWPEVRDWPKRGGKYVPWLDSALVCILREKKEQFETCEPAFLVWVSGDELLPVFKPSITRVVEQYGQEFDHVAGVIIFHPRLIWDLTENPLYFQYEELKRVGLFDAIDALRERNTGL